MTLLRARSASARCCAAKLSRETCKTRMTELGAGGWLVIDKPAGITSNRVVTKLKHATGMKAGHGGTLDPLATGVLPVALGEATKTVSYVMDGAKTYLWQVTWGEARSTDDGEGVIVATSERRPTESEIEAALPAFVGHISQVPPVFSAIKVAGQ